MQYKNPVISTNNHRLTSGFRTAERPTHDGMDFTDGQRLELSQNVDILAFADGTVTDTIVNNASIGYGVSIAHEGKILTRYFHMKAGSVKVKTGDKVKKGQPIGVMGTTGESTGIHLHFGVKENSTAYTNGSYVNPEPYLKGEKNIISQNEEELMSKEYEELKKLIETNSTAITKLEKNTEQTKPQWGYMTDADFPEKLKPIVQRLYDSGSGDFKLANGSLGISKDMARLLIALDDLGFFNK